MSLLSKVFVLACAAANAACAAGCASHSCEAVGYSCGRTTITLQSPNDVWVASDYTLSLNIDGVAGQCTLSNVSSAGQPSTSDISGSCTMGANSTLAFTAVLACPAPVCNQNACSQGACTPVAGHFRMILTVNALPAQIGVTLTEAGKQLLDQTFMPKAITTEPDGAGCGTCTNASLTAQVTSG